MMRIFRNITSAVLAIFTLALGWIVVSDRLAQPRRADTAPLIAKAAHYHAPIKRANLAELT